MHLVKGCWHFCECISNSLDKLSTSCRLQVVHGRPLAGGFCCRAEVHNTESCVTVDERAKWIGIKVTSRWAEETSFYVYEIYVIERGERGHVKVSAVVTKGVKDIAVSRDTY